MLEQVHILSPHFSTLRHRSREDEDSSSEVESIDGLSDGLELSAHLVSPSRVPALDRPPPSNEPWSEETWKDNVLIEYFAGWAVANAAYHRKFVAISTFSHKAYNKWGHVCHIQKTSIYTHHYHRLRFSGLKNSCREKASNMLSRSLELEVVGWTDINPSLLTSFVRESGLNVRSAMVYILMRCRAGCLILPPDTKSRSHYLVFSFQTIVPA